MGDCMRSAQLDSNNTVINFAEVVAFDGVQFVIPLDSIVGSIWNGASFEHPIPLLPTFAQLETAVQLQLDTLAQSWGYADIATACTYVGDPCAKFDREGAALRIWRSVTWQATEELEAQITAGSTQMPATVAAAIVLMPGEPARPI
jgi:hypothetical protein